MPPYPVHRRPYGLPIAIGLMILGLALITDTLVIGAIVLRTLALVLAITFAVRYAKKPWRSTGEGHHLMAFTVITAAFLIFAMVTNAVAYFDPHTPSLDGTYPGRAVIAFVLFMAISWELWERNRLLTAANNEEKMERLRR